jgi:hypothetical protein
VDVAARHAVARGVEVVFVDNRVVTFEGAMEPDTALDDAIGLAIARGTTRNGSPAEENRG